MSEQIIAYGAELERSADGTTWTTLPEVKGVAVPTVTTEYLDATSLDSPGGYREYIKGLKDPGEISVPMGYTADGYEQVLEDQEAADSIYYRLTLKTQPSQATGDVFEFRAFPTAEMDAGDIGEIVGMNLNLRLTGEVTWTRGTAA